MVSLSLTGVWGLGFGVVSGVVERDAIVDAGVYAPPVDAHAVVLVKLLTEKNRFRGEIDFGVAPREIFRQVQGARNPSIDGVAGQVAISVDAV